MSSFRVAPLTRQSVIRIEGMKNLSSCLCRGCEKCLCGTRREVSAFALPLQGVATFETLTFLQTTALQHCINHLPPFGGRRISPALFILRSPSGRRRIVLTVYWLIPFIFSFHDLRLLRYAFQYADHLVVLNLILLVVPTIPRFESVRIVKLQKLGAIRLTLDKNKFATD